VPPKSVSVQDEGILEAVQALQGGAPSAAFEVIYNRYRRPLYYFFANQSALREEAEDLAQATLWRAFERIHQYQPEEHASFGAWLRTIAENLWKNAVRDGQALKRSVPGETVELPEGDAEGAARDTPRAPAPDPEEAVLARERTRVIQEAIVSLPEGMRRCAELRIGGDLKYEDIARILGIGLNSVRSQLFEARRRLKPVLDTYFQGVEF
jgi:RNA polymerase sigma-70 factor (ECF subfamily)